MSIAPKIPLEVAKWIFLGCILMSFLLLFLDIRKSRLIIESRDISYACTSVIASRYYTLRSYSHYCFFAQINDSKKTTDEIAFFVFFTLKETHGYFLPPLLLPVGWKRLLLAEAPRQVVNGVTLWAIAEKVFAKGIDSVSMKTGIDSLGSTNMQKVMTGTMAFSFFIFFISFMMVCIASIMYIPLLCHIMGNLKEYCCHKIDKRIAELLKKQARKRVAQARKAEIMAQKGAAGRNIPMQTIQPTLPNVEMFDEEKRPISAMYGPADFALPQMMADRGMAMSPVPLYNPPRMPGARRGSGSSVNTDVSGWNGSQAGGPRGLGPKRSYGNLNVAHQQGMVDPQTMPGYMYTDPSAPSQGSFYRESVYQPQGHQVQPQGQNPDDYTSEYSGDGYQSDYSAAPLHHRDSDQSTVAGSDPHAQGYPRGPAPPQQYYESPRPLPRSVPPAEYPARPSTPSSNYGSPMPERRVVQQTNIDYGSPMPERRVVQQTNVDYGSPMPERRVVQQTNVDYGSPMISERRVVQQTNVVPSRYQDQPARQARGPYQTQGQNPPW
ncbi:hypothetical protein BC938DRAFT_471545 [Jimgerdemannia flammicorona]|uniref:Uncharacterized protein n=1 Tax=Jimgerdemannia flammicorona TaxID=994334 RepID=A0A433Q7V4_9FUNG|nr:hypothetical protein BC938DRAFT_471545 [Jimgerdemannia flammicorona]